MFKEVDPRQDFIALEHEIIKFWDKNQIVKKYLSKNEKSPKRWSFLDGPITANNPMGVHHAWGRTLKDLWQRYYTLKGYKQRYQNGFDCQGLWVEVEVEKELGFKNKKDIEKYGVGKFVNKCKDRVNKYANIITDQSIRLAEWMHWEDSYFTMSEENNYTIWHFLKVCYENGWIYQGTDSVPWCPRCGTAISQHEILTESYKELTHDSIFFKLPIKTGKFKGYKLLVWTTTPWTIPANVAVAADPKKEYVIAQVDDDRMILIKSRARKILGNKFKEIKTILGKELIDQNYDAPFSNLSGVKKTFGNYDYKVVASDELILPVSEEEGTGLVHIAPGAGTEDFQLGKLRELPVLNVINSEANYLDHMDEFAGKNAKDNPDIIFDFIKKEKNGQYFYKIVPYKHRYPTCWRCKTELVWRNVEEWYIAMDKPSKSSKKTYRERMIEVAKKINWIPNWGKARELDWLENMHDWLISKKRYWGLALPIWKCDKCGHFEVIGSKDELKDRAKKGWDIFNGHTPHKPWIDEVKIKCTKCGELASRISDVGNPWLDAGIVPFSTYIDPKTKKVSYLTDKKYWEKWFPADFVTESFPGQFKNWFYALIAMSTALEDANPYKNLLGHAMVRDEHGEEMHKSAGNAIPFHEAAEKMGVDVMRWMYASHNPVHNLNFGYAPAKEILRRFVLTLWNSYSFFITYANVDKFDKNNTISLKNRTLLDKWILFKLDILVKENEKLLSEYDSYKATQNIEEFINDLSTWYLRLSRKRRDDNFYVTMMEVLKKLCILLSIFMPHISESIYQNIKKTNDKLSVHLEDWPDVNIDNNSNKILEDMKKVREIVEIAHAIRREKGIKVRQPLSELIINKISFKDKEYIEILEKELNIKKIKFVSKLLKDKNYELKTSNHISIALNTEITKELMEEGVLREIVRQIQFLRKKAGFKALDKVNLYWDCDDMQMCELIKKNIKNIKKSTLVKSDIKQKNSKSKYKKELDTKIGKVYISIQ